MHVVHREQSRTATRDSYIINTTQLPSRKSTQQKPIIPCTTQFVAMGRSSRPAKFQHSKRAQVLDDEGWTHVTTTTSRRPAPRSHNPIKAVEDQLTPAEFPDDLAFERLKDRYEWHKGRWQESMIWNAVKRTLNAELSRWPPGSIDNCVCVGLGSPSGLLRGGLVDRRSVSLFQLAALVSILEFICTDDPLSAES